VLDSVLFFNFYLVLDSVRQLKQAHFAVEKQFCVVLVLFAFNLVQVEFGLIWLFLSFMESAETLVWAIFCSDFAAWSFSLLSWECCRSLSTLSTPFFIRKVLFCTSASWHRLPRVFRAKIRISESLKSFSSKTKFPIIPVSFAIYF